jgi:hypothetical protein
MTAADHPPPATCPRRRKADPRSRPSSFEEPATTEGYEDPGTDIAPTRLDAPLDPHAPTRTPSSAEGCSLPDEDMPETVDFDGTA